MTSGARVAAVIVAFHPDARRLDNLVDVLLSGPAASVCVIDNTPGGSDWRPKAETRLDVVTFGENRGIAAAQNHGIRSALAAAHTHVILFDQDSAPPTDMIERLLSVEAELMAQGQRVAACGPVFIDRKSGVTSTATEYGWSIVHKSIDPTPAGVATDSLIASGALIRAEALHQIGGMIDALFIDWVDVEWTLRAKSKGLRCFSTARVAMSHSIGDEAARLGNKVFNVHSDFRKFYIVRNALLLTRLPYIPIEARIAIVFKVFMKYLPAYLWLGPGRLAVLGQFARALRSGVTLPSSALVPAQFPKVGAR